MTLYYASRRSVKVLEPIPVPDRLKSEYPTDVHHVVLATQDLIEAEIFAVFSRRDAPPFTYSKDRNGNWTVSCPVSRKTLRQWQNEHYYIYEIDSETATAFTQKPGNSIYYCSKDVLPTRKTQKTVKQALQEWESSGKVEIHYNGEREFPRVKG